MATRNKIRRFLRFGRRVRRHTSARWVACLLARGTDGANGDVRSHPRTSPLVPADAPLVCSPDDETSPGSDVEGSCFAPIDTYAVGEASSRTTSAGRHAYGSGRM